MMKKAIVALALLLGATSASLAYSHHHRAYYNYAPGYGHSSIYIQGGGVSGDLSIGSQR